MAWRSTGVGAQLKRWLWIAKLWPSGGCQCNYLARLMDLAGPAEVRANVDAWAQRMAKSAGALLGAAAPKQEALRKLILKACDTVEGRERRGDEYADVTVCVTYHKRPDDLERLLNTIPVAIKTVVEETGGNLSAARNRLLAKVNTRYAMIIEEDMAWRYDTNLHRLRDVLESDSTIDIVGGRVHDPRESWRHDMSVREGELVCTPAGRPFEFTPAGTAYQRCELIPNWFLMRSGLGVAWDEALELCEHRDWFIRVKDAGAGVAYCPQSAIDHFASRPSAEYKRDRVDRAQGFFRAAERKHGLKFGKPPAAGDPANIVVMAVTNSGTTVATRMAAALGWSTGETDAFAESPTVHKLNLRAQRKSLDLKAAADYLANLPRPWLIKDPKFRDVLEQWLPVLAPYTPTLVYLTRDPAAIRDSWHRRGFDPRDVEYAIRQCERQYDAYPWARRTLDFERIEDAVRLFSVDASAADVLEPAPAGG